MAEDKKTKTLQDIKSKSNINCQHESSGLTYYPASKKFNPDVGWENILRYLKGLYGSNKERFKAYFINGIDDLLWMEFIEYALDNFDSISPFSYHEAFELDQTFSAMVFSSIDVGEMMANLDAQRLHTDGIEVTRKTYDEDGTFLGEKTYHNIYEVYKADGSKIGAARTECYAVKCWCTSTEKEHWLWLDGYYSDPLEAIASTFRVHDTILPYIKELKRQGDILLVELTEDVHPLKDENGKDKEAKLVSLDKNIYFNMLTSET